MTTTVGRGWAAAARAAALIAVIAAGSAPLAAQKDGPAELAARMTGVWRLNKELSPDLANPGGGRGRGRGGGPALAAAALPFLQRGGRGGGGEPGFEQPAMTDAEAAAQAALSAIQQVPLEVTIEATAALVKFVEPRGDSQFQIDGRNTTVSVPGGSIKVRSRWDRAALRQEFSSAQRVLRRTWSLDGAGRLVLAQKVESLTFNSREARAVFDRQ